MNRKDRSKTYIKLRKEFPTLTYDAFDIKLVRGRLKFSYKFSLNKKIVFNPWVEFPERTFYKFSSIDPQVIENMAFHIGMVELISYWKATCSPQIIVKPFYLDREQINWWKKLFFEGLGEFFYLNGLDPDPENFVEFECSRKKLPAKNLLVLNDSYIVPVGGGKDSVVSLELLKNFELTPLILNPRQASIGATRVAGFKQDQIVEVRRKIDPKLLELNAEGFLNGHTPFSALLAFISLVGATLCGHRNIALSNESSANEATIPGTNINHQYSKSFEFEEDFRWYVSKYIDDNLNYFSFLRPLNELQIAQIFSKHPDYYQVFKSCNVGSKTDSWCKKCPKCLFTYTILSPFVEKDVLRKIFGANLIDDPQLTEIFNQLTGNSDVKPFDCIGTIDEVNVAVQHLIKKLGNNDIPFLLASYKTLQKTPYPSKSLYTYLKMFDLKNNLSDQEFRLLQQSL